MTTEEKRTPITVVIVTYRSRSTIGECLDNLQEAFLEDMAKVIVVDNDSQDGTADFIEEHYPWVRLIRSNENLGFGRGCNLGFQFLESPYVLFLNPDAVLSVESLLKMLTFMEQHPEIGIAGPAILEGDSHWQSAGLLTTPATLIKSRIGWKNAYPDKRVVTPESPPFQTSWVCGAAMMIRAQAFRQLEGFDPNFFLYFEETDLCKRAVSEGIQIWTVGHAVARHIAGASAKQSGDDFASGCIAKHYYFSQNYYIRKHYGSRVALLIPFFLRLIDHGRSLLRCLLRLKSVTNCSSKTLP